MISCSKRRCYISLHLPISPSISQVSAMDFFYKFATGPEALPDLFFRAVRVRVRARDRDRVRASVRV